MMGLDPPEAGYSRSAVAGMVGNGICQSKTHKDEGPRE